MAVLTDLLAMKEELKQLQHVSQAISMLQCAKSAMQEALQPLQEIKDSGSFDTLSTSLKQALLAAFNVVKNADTAFNNGIVNELLAPEVVEEPGEPLI